MSLASLLLKYWDDEKPKKILAWALDIIQQGQIDPTLAELRLHRANSTVQAVLIHANGDIIGTESWTFLHSNPREFEVWFQGNDHARMSMTESTPQPRKNS